MGHTPINVAGDSGCTLWERRKSGADAIGRKDYRAARLQMIGKGAERRLNILLNARQIGIREERTRPVARFPFGRDANGVRLSSTLLGLPTEPSASHVVAKHEQGVRLCLQIGSAIAFNEAQSHAENMP